MLNGVILLRFPTKIDIRMLKISADKTPDIPTEVSEYGDSVAMDHILKPWRDVCEVLITKPGRELGLAKSYSSISL